MFIYFVVVGWSPHPPFRLKGFRMFEKLIDMIVNWSVGWQFALLFLFLLFLGGVCKYIVILFRGWPPVDSNESEEPHGD